MHTIKPLGAHSLLLLKRTVTEVLVLCDTRVFVFMYVRKYGSQRKRKKQDEMSVNSQSGRRSEQK